MKNTVKNWWLILIKGIVLILLAFFVFNHPVGSLLGLTMYLSIGLLFTGVVLIITSLSSMKTDEAWGWKLAEGILDVLFALVLISNPGITAAVFPFIIGFWMMFYGIMIFANAFQAKKSGDSAWWINLISGILTVLFGYFISSNLLVGAISITIWIALGLLIAGVLNISVSLRLKNISKQIDA